MLLFASFFCFFSLFLSGWWVFLFAFVCLFWWVFLWVFFFFFGGGFNNPENNLIAKYLIIDAVLQ